MDFEIVGEITNIETIAAGTGVRDRAHCVDSMAGGDGAS
jgi:hypothetical protein